MIAIAIGNGSTRWETSVELIRLLVSHLASFEFVIVPCGGCDVGHARDLAIHAWRTKFTECGKLLFIDSDIRFSSDDIERLVQWDLPIVAGMYPLSAKKLRWSFNGQALASTTVPGLWEVIEVCTGMLCIDYSVIEDLILRGAAPKFAIEDWEYRGEVGYEFFFMGVKDGRRYSEDFWFSRIAREAGYTLYVDPTIQVDHIKTVGLLSFFLGDERTKFTVQEAGTLSLNGAK